MSDFDEKLKEIIDDAQKYYNDEPFQFVAQIKQLISEVIGEEEGKKVVPPNKNDSYESLNAQFRVMKYNQEQMPIRNELRKELRHAFNLKEE